MRNHRDYTLTARYVVLGAAIFCVLAAAAPFRSMHSLFAESTAMAAAGQIPTQIPTKVPGHETGPKGLGQEGVAHVRVNLVRLYVTVRDKHGAIVQNLTKNDFRVYEDGQLQKIDFFSKDMTDPVTLGLLIDTSGSQNDLLDAEKETAKDFLKQFMRKGDLATVISFDTQVNLLADFTDDQAVLDRAIDRAEINVPVGLGPFPQTNVTGTALYDAIYLTCRGQLASQAGRKALIILTDAQDEGSQHTLNEAITAAQEANTVIHVLLISSPGQYWMGGQSYIGGSVAEEMAKQTGGRVLSIRREKDLDKAFRELSEELRSQYILAYYPTNKTMDGTFRKIKVETTQHGLRVLTRKGYYAPVE